MRKCGQERTFTYASARGDPGLWLTAHLTRSSRVGRANQLKALCLCPRPEERYLARLGGAPRQLVPQAIDQADPRTDQLMEHLVVRRQRVWPRRCELFGSLNLARKLDQLFARNSGSQVGKLLSLFIIDVVPQ